MYGPGGVLAEARQLFSPAAPGELHLVHRLDQLTSGVLLLALGREALRAAHAAWQGSITKTYVARTRGVPSPREGTVDVPLLEHRSGKPELLARAVRAAYGPARAGQLLVGRHVGGIPPLPPPGRTAAHPAGRPARTDYRVLEDDGATALVELVPRQGRMHQLRVHLLSLGTPLLEDPVYDPQAGSSAAGAARPFLHAWRLVWRDPPGVPPSTVWTWEASLER